LEAKKGNRVKVHYTVKESNGEVIESSDNTMPLEFAIGEGRVIPGFENGVTGMKVDETKTVNVPCEDAYGARDDTKTFEFARKNSPTDFDPRIGDMVQLHRPDGKAFSVKVLEKRETGFLMDANHPLAGKDLIFDLKLVEIIK
jgi:peptidylprolyl isomerase